MSNVPFVSINMHWHEQQEVVHTEERGGSGYQIFVSLIAKGLCTNAEQLTSNWFEVEGLLRVKEFLALVDASLGILSSL